MKRLFDFAIILLLLVSLLVGCGAPSDNPGNADGDSGATDGGSHDGGVDNPADKPTDDPTDKPTDDPTDKPTDDPTDKPTDDPADKPTDDPDVHTHSYVQKNTDEKYFVTEANCKSGATYYFSCECGERGTQIFEVGEPNGKHRFVGGVCDICDESCMHYGGTPSCKSQAICEVCFEPYGELSDHTGGTPSCKSQAICEVCSEPYGELSDHTGGTPSCKSQAICEVCSEPYGELGDHTGGTPSCKSQAICEVCSEPYGELGDHIGGTPSCKSQAICEVCSEPYGEMWDHDYTYSEQRVEPDCENDGLLTMYCICGESVTEIIESEGHDYRDWSEYVPATCSEGGERIRSCRACSEIERQPTDPTSHSYTKVISEVSTEGSDTVTLVCDMCGSAAGASYKGLYLTESGAMLLEGCENDYSFAVYCREGVDYVREHLGITRIHLYDEAMGGNADVLLDYSLSEIGDNLYLVAPVSNYSEGATYCAATDGGVSFIDKPGYSFFFRIRGEEVANIEYNQNILFLKALYERANQPYYYTCEYDEQQELYGIFIPEGVGVDGSYVGSLLAVGDCVSFAEAENLSSDEVLIGKIEYVSRVEEGVTLVVLSIPSIGEIYSRLHVNGNGLPEQDESIVSDEMKAMAVEALCTDDDFISALAGANIAAINYASSVGLTAEPKTEFDPADVVVKVEVENVEGGKVTVIMSLTYDHKIPIKDGDIELGTVKVTIAFTSTYTFDINAYSNFEEYKDDVSDVLTFECTLINTINNTFDLSISLDMAYNYTGEPMFALNLDSGKIHTTTCRYAPPVPGGNFHFMTLSELEETGEYKWRGCSVCQPFAEEKSGFVVNMESGALHIATCSYVDSIHSGNRSYYKTFPHHLSTTPCTVCHPENYTKTLEQYLTESTKDASFGEMFDTMIEIMGDRFSGDGASPIDDDTKPRVTLRFYCFEVPVYVEPRIDFDLKANFSLHYEVEVKNTVFAALVYDGDGCRVIGDCILGLPEKNVKVDVTGTLKIEIGVITEVRVGFRYVSKYVYIGLLGEAGMYIKASGVYHADTELSEEYYAARLEIGTYAESKCTYRVIGIVRANSLSIKDKTYTPIFNSGDDKIYYRFADYDGEISISNLRKYRPPSDLLEVYYYDLVKMETLIGRLRWTEKEQYGFECSFTDEEGNTLDYLVFKDGSIHVLDGAPDSFTAYMTVKVFDRVQYDNMIDYFGKPNKGGCAVFLAEKVIKINYSYEDTTDNMESALGIYAGTYGVGTDLFGTQQYRKLLVGVHRTSELIEDEQMLKFYAVLASYVEVDENGNPQHVYTVEDLVDALLKMDCEYVVINYNKPAGANGDTLTVISASVAYYDGGVKTNAVSDYFLESEESILLHVDNVSVDKDGNVTGDVYVDSTKTEYLGQLNLSKTELYN